MVDVNHIQFHSYLVFCLQPFTLEQLSVWEPGGGLRTWLEGVEVCAAHFCALARQENHELTELLQNYWRCRRQLTQSHTQLHTQSSECKSTQSRLWSFRDEQLTLQVQEIRKYLSILSKMKTLCLIMSNIWPPHQGLCADQSKVCGYHRFQQADFSQSVLTELGKLFEARSELLHQKVALHAYTALLSRLQVESYLYHLLKGERRIFSACRRNDQKISVSDCFWGKLEASKQTTVWHCCSTAIKTVAVHAVWDCQMEK